jgi:hypothetical protein
MNKKEIKKAVHDNGFFLSFPIQTNNLNKFKSEESNIPSDSFGWGGIASQEVINMNGYGIRLKAWKPAITDYLNNNPIIFFGHDDNQALGQTLSAKVTKESLEVFGYVRRQADQQYAAGNIEAGIYRMLSTGHITKDFEFENEKSGEVMDKKAFLEKVNKEGYGEWLDNWYMWVTKLRFLEWSIVGLGSVQTAFKSNTSEDIWLNHFHLNKEDIMTKNLVTGETLENEGGTPEVVEETTLVEGEQPETVEVEPTAEQANDEETPAQTEPESEEEEESPETTEEETQPESVETPDEVVTEPEAVEENKVQDLAINDLIGETRRIALLTGQKVLELEARYNALEQRINSTPSKKAIRTVSEVNSGQSSRTLADLLNI